MVGSIEEIDNSILHPKENTAKAFSGNARDGMDFCKIPLRELKKIKAICLRKNNPHTAILL